MNAPADLIRLTQFSHGGGCGCKIAPAVLSEILANTPIRGLPKDLLVGIESSDDAAVYRLNDEQALVATTDFFTPIVDDPFDFGRIAATNALSDVYAMGGRPILALAILGMPLGKIDPETVKRIVAGGASVCAAAGIPVPGGPAPARRCACPRWRGGSGARGLPDRRVHAELVELRRRGGAAAGPARLAARPSLRPADQRRPADRRCPGGCPGASRAYPRGR